MGVVPNLMKGADHSPTSSTPRPVRCRCPALHLPQNPYFHNKTLRRAIGQGVDEGTHIDWKDAAHNLTVKVARGGRTSAATQHPLGFCSQGPQDG
jgi:hypothetical protein